MKLWRTKNGANFMVPIFGPPCIQYIALVPKTRHKDGISLGPYIQFRICNA